MDRDQIKSTFDRQAATYDQQWARVEDIIEAGGFEAPVRFFQGGLIHAWFAKRLLRLPDSTH